MAEQPPSNDQPTGDEPSRGQSGPPNGPQWGPSSGQQQGQQWGPPQGQQWGPQQAGQQWGPPPPAKKKRHGCLWAILGAIAVIIIIIVIVIAVAVAGSSGDSSNSSGQGASDTCAGKTYPDQQKKDLCADASGSVTLDGILVTATPFSAKTDPIGGKALCTNVTIKNTTSKSQDYNVFDFKVQTPGGVVASTSAIGGGGTLDSGTLIAGASKTGLVCTKDTGEKGTYVFIYKPNAFNSDRGIWLFPL